MAPLNLFIFKSLFFLLLSHRFILYSLFSSEALVVASRDARLSVSFDNANLQLIFYANAVKGDGHLH